MISKNVFKKADAIIMENDSVRVTILPEHGGKIVSFYDKIKNFESIFQNKEDEYRNPALHDNFEDYDASGFDDAFPSINPEYIKTEDGVIYYPDHGEIWQLIFDYYIENNTLELNADSKILPYRFKKSITLAENGIIIDYNIKNTGNFSFPCFWTMHCLFNCREDMELLFPPETKEVLVVENSSHLGDVGEVHLFPETYSKQGELYLLDRVYPAASKKYEKYYVNGKVEKGALGIKYPSENVRLSITYDVKKLPYLGFWVTEGGFRGDYNCALEPSNGFYDSISIAERNNALIRLEPGNTMEFSIRLSFEKEYENNLTLL